MTTVILTLVVGGVWVSLILASLLNRVGRLDRWALALLIVTVLDGVALVLIGAHINPFVLVAIDTFNIGDIGLSMVVRHIVLAPVVYVMARWGSPKFLLAVYLGCYTILAIMLKFSCLMG